MWDYPVREQYTHLLKVIKDTGTFVTPEDGFAAVDRATEGNFAFIHDASEVCNFVLGGAGRLSHGLGRLLCTCSTILPCYLSDSAITPSAQAELGRQWNDLNQCQPNPGGKPPAPPCNTGSVRLCVTTFSEFCQYNKN